MLRLAFQMLLESAEKQAFEELAKELPVRLDDVEVAAQGDMNEIRIASGRSRKQVRIVKADDSVTDIR